MAPGSVPAKSAEPAGSARERVEILVQRGDVEAAFELLERIHGHEEAPGYFAEAARSPDRGLAVLGYSVGTARTILFVLAPGGRLEARTLPAGEAKLAAQVRAFRETIARARPEATALGAALFRELVRPAGRALDGADRILFIPDGPLHRLPFAALTVPEDGERGGRFLVEWKPIHVAASLKAHAGLRHSRAASRRGGKLLAFGDPLYALAAEDVKTAARHEDATAVLRSAPSLERLPASGEEARAIASLFGAAATAMEGAEASERNARRLLPRADRIHFATHALIDEESPFDSAIVLSLPGDAASGRDDGLLQVREILESVRIDADLVTLSGCGTALGSQVPGEGFVGLARAFRRAGARSVVASLWNVSDKGTAILMQRFYAHLKDGLPKDEALRAAQIDLIRGPASGSRAGWGPRRGVKVLSRSDGTPASLSAPYYWAGFELLGDWE